VRGLGPSRGSGSLAAGESETEPDDLEQIFIDSHAHLLVCSGVDTEAKVAVLEPALFQRINRKLKPENEQLRTARGFSDGFPCENARRSGGIRRELGVLQPWEKVGSESQQHGTSERVRREAASGMRRMAV
jgi:hypothetical protein